VRPEPRVWVKWGKFEEEHSKLEKACEVFQTALGFYGDDEEQIEKAQVVFSVFAKMETRPKEYEHARVIYKRGVGHQDMWSIVNEDINMRSETPGTRKY